MGAFTDTIFLANSSFITVDLESLNHRHLERNSRDFSEIVQVNCLWYRSTFLAQAIISLRCVYLFLFCLYRYVGIENPFRALHFYLIARFYVLVMLRYNNLKKT